MTWPAEKSLPSRIPNLGWPGSWHVIFDEAEKERVLGISIELRGMSLV